jgi:hypothetical protein
MRRAFAHEAILALAPDVDVQAPGAAITTALCGHWAHEPPCPLAPHHTSVQRLDGGVEVRTLFVVDPGREPEVRRRIEAALTDHPRWQVLSSGADVVAPEETEQVLRLAEN